MGFKGQRALTEHAACHEPSSALYGDEQSERSPQPGRPGTSTTIPPYGSGDWAQRRKLTARTYVCNTYIMHTNQPAAVNTEAANVTPALRNTYLGTQQFFLSAADAASTAMGAVGPLGNRSDVTPLLAARL